MRSSIAHDEAMNITERLGRLIDSLTRKHSTRMELRRQRRPLSMERMEDRRVLAVIELATLSASQGSVIYGAHPGDNTGVSVSSAGDVNGDGFDDVIVGANRSEAGGTAAANAGVSYVVFGGASLPASFDLAGLGTAGIQIIGKDSADYSGFSVSSAGDMNGDGFGDLVIGAGASDSINNSRVDAGESYVIFGGASLPTTIELNNIGLLGFTIFGADTTDLAGYAVSSAGTLTMMDTMI